MRIKDSLSKRGSPFIHNSSVNRPHPNEVVLKYVFVSLPSCTSI